MRENPCYWLTANVTTKMNICHHFRHLQGIIQAYTRHHFSVYLCDKANIKVTHNVCCPISCLLFKTMHQSIPLTLVVLVKCSSVSVAQGTTAFFSLSILRLQTVRHETQTYETRAKRCLVTRSARGQPPDHKASSNDCIDLPMVKQIHMKLSLQNRNECWSFLLK